MKKFILPLLASMFLLAGCTENARVVTHYYSVEPNQWQQSITTYDDGTYDVNYYYASFRNIDIDRMVIDNGVVLAYYIDAEGRDNILPYTLYMKGTDGAGNTFYYQERIEFDITEEVITFKIKDSDFHTSQSMQNIGRMKFKVCAISNY